MGWLNNYLLTNTLGKPVSSIINFFKKPISSEIEKSIEARNKETIIQRISEDTLKEFSNEPFFQIFQREFLRYINDVYDDIYSQGNSISEKNIEAIIDHYYNEKSYNSFYRSSAYEAIKKVVKKIHSEIYAPHSSSDRMMLSSTNEICAKLDEILLKSSENNDLIKSLVKCNEDKSFTSENCIVIENNQNMLIHPDKKVPQYIILYFCKYGIEEFSSFEELLSHLQFSGNEQLVTVGYNEVIFDDNTIEKNTFSDYFGDVISLKLDYDENLVSAVKLKIQLPKKVYSISIEDFNFEVIVPQYDVYFTRERNEDIITTTWNDVTANTNVSIKLIMKISISTQTVVGFSFNIFAKEPQSVYSHLMYYKVINKIQHSSGIVFRDIRSKELLFQSKSVNVNISEDELSYFLDLYNTALWIEDNYKVRLTVPDSIEYSDYIHLKMLKAIKEKGTYTFPDYYQIDISLCAPENEIINLDTDKEYSFSFNTNYVEIWDTKIDFSSDSPLYIIVQSAKLEKNEDELKASSTGNVYASFIAPDKLIDKNKTT